MTDYGLTRGNILSTMNMALGIEYSGAITEPMIILKAQQEKQIITPWVPVMRSLKAANGLPFKCYCRAWLL
jgi:hypothetical protein